MIVLGLGSNLGDRLHNLSSAVKMLNVILREVKTSSIYESKAQLPENAPKSWNIKYLNMVITGETNIPAEQLLNKIKEIEYSLGREKKYDTWSPRIIDIDILLYNNIITKSDRLTIPHNLLLNRDFALVPMVEICPELIYYGDGEFNSKTMLQIASEQFGYPNLPNSISKTELCLN
jgi:2-amino-4-hydroxy-6-hydroxymethyldihydropteridine diphosphokinase